MFFSAKLLYPVFVVAGFAASAFAIPTAEPGPELVARQANALSSVQTLQTTVAPIVNQLTQAAATKSDPTSIIEQLESIMNSAASSMTQASALSSAAKVDASAFVDVSADIVVSIVVALGRFSILDIFLSAKVDTFLSTFISAADKVSPGAAASIGKRIPTIDLDIFVSLKLVLSARILAIIDILGIIIL